MTLQDIQIWQLLAGLGLFLFGMFMLEEAIKTLAGRAFKIFLRKQTGNRVKAVLSGAFVTTILQSSSMVSLLVMSFAGAGIIGLRNGIGMIMGANLGTTATGWLVSLVGFKLDIETFIMPFLAIGGLGIIFLKSPRWSNLSKLLMGFSFMFLGLSYMKDGFATFAAHLDLSFLEGKPAVIFVLFGVLLAASIQSSSAAMMIVLSSLAVGMITIEQGAYLVIGGDLGTTITALIGTVKGNLIRRKVGFSQFYFNLFSGTLAFFTLPLLLLLITEKLQVKDPLIAVVLFHSAFNLLGILILLPFLGLFTRFIDKVVKDREKKQSLVLSQASPSEPYAATYALEKESTVFFKRAIEVNQLFFKKTGNPETEYFKLKSYEEEIVQFYIPLMQSALTEQEAKKTNLLIASIRNATLSAKDLKDIHHNMVELRSAVTEQYFNWFQQIRNHQKLFYKTLGRANEQLSLADSTELELAKELQNQNYKHENEALFRIVSALDQQEFDTPSLMNMIREINNSNESLLRSIRFLNQAIELKTN
jgi:phosphate:Na+ symporter